MDEISDWQIILILLFGPVMVIPFIGYMIYEKLKR